MEINGLRKEVGRQLGAEHEDESKKKRRGIKNDIWHEILSSARRFSRCVPHLSRKKEKIFVVLAV
jgi:hypothetical protein